ncbi:MAG: chromate transporter, partial [Meiothermus sp.]
MKVPLDKLFWAFLSIGLVAFGGGGNAQIYSAIVRRRGWMSDREFLETTALCRILPGPVFANLAAHLGARLGGVPGGILALLGVLTPGATLMLLLSL